MSRTKSQRIHHNETFIQGFDKPRNCLENKYIDVEYWPIVAAVRIYYDSDLRVIHLGAKYRFIHPDYPKDQDLPNEFEGYGFTRDPSASFVEINFKESEDDKDGKYNVLAEVSATGTKITDITFLFGDGKEFL